MRSRTWAALMKPTQADSGPLTHFARDSVIAPFNYPRSACCSGHSSLPLTAIVKPSIVKSECGSVVFFTAGKTLSGCPGVGGKALCVVTNDAPQLSAMCDRISWMPR